MASSVSADNVDHMKQQLHDEIERMSPERLEAVRRMMLMFDIAETAAQLNRDFDADEAAGLLTPEKIDQAIRDARAALRRA
jgi:hypothetical protein